VFYNLVVLLVCLGICNSCFTDKYNKIKANCCVRCSARGLAVQCGALTANFRQQRVRRSGVRRCMLAIEGRRRQQEGLGGEPGEQLLHFAARKQSVVGSRHWCTFADRRRRSSRQRRLLW